MALEQINSNEEKKKPKRFKTAMGSIYEYMLDGRTKRFKTAVNKEQASQDAIVFIPN